MAIKWWSVKIKDRADKDYLALNARKFVEEKCPGVISNLERKKLADIVRVKFPDGTTSLYLDDIKDVLSTALGKIGASLAISEDESGFRNNLPVARGVKNTVNIIPTRLKVEFFYIRDPQGSSARTYLKDSKVTVSILHEKALQPIKKITENGVADFGVVLPGKYKITAEYPKSDECKYDWIDKTRDVVLKSGTEELVEFLVEPLYQQVQFIAHCLLTIPNQMYEMAPADDRFLEVDDSGGKRTFKFKEEPVVGELYKLNDLTPPLRSYMVKAEVENTGEGKLNFQRVYWRLDELDMTAPPLKYIKIVSQTENSCSCEFKEGYSREDLEGKTLKTEMIDIQIPAREYWRLDELVKADPTLKCIKVINQTENTCSCEFEDGFTRSALDGKPLETDKMKIQLPSDGSEKPEFTLQLKEKKPTGVFKFTLQLREKKPYWTLAELDVKDKAGLNFDRIEIGELLTNTPNVYEITFKDPVSTPTSKSTGPPPPPGSGGSPKVGGSPSGPPPPGIGGPVKAVINRDPNDESKGTLTMNVVPRKILYWDLADVDPGTLDPSKIEIIKPAVRTNPSTYKFKLKVNPNAVKKFTKADLKGKWKAEYHGYLDDKIDIEERIKFVADTLKIAYAESKKGPTILKVFIIPECFFQGLYGAYLTDDAAELISKLQNLVKDEKWKDWVFAFGTVNRVYQGLQPSGVVVNKPIYEMANHAPVIRGGLSDSLGFGETSTRLIQKLVNSAELADDDTLIRNKEAEKIRPQAVNEYVQFEATENDEKVARKLEELLKATIADSFNLPKNDSTEEDQKEDLWSDLKEDLKSLIGELGIARVVRQIRTVNNSEVNAKPLTDWVYGAKSLDPEKEVSEILYRTKKTCLPVLKDATLMVLKTRWNRLDPKTEFNKSNWTADDVKRASVLNMSLPDFADAAKDSGFRMPYQQKKIREQVATLKLDVDAAATKDFVPEPLDLSFEPSVFPIWRKILEIYAKDAIPLEFTQDTMNLNDYCFAGPRKPGPWYANLEKAKTSLTKEGKSEVRQPCKRMVFGLEICADHPTKRLSKLNKPATATEEYIDIDIHLLPSAGMSPNYFAARQGGYILNCDGWNKAPAVGGKKIKVAFDGPQPEVEGDEVSATPVYPHSALGKREGDSTNVSACLIPTVVDTLNTDLSKVIFNYGPGELHFYALQELPK